MLELSDFDYHLPKELIAQYPLRERDSARLLVLDRRTSKIEHRSFKEIINYFTAGDLVVLNDTKVLPCRLQGRRQTGGKVELLLLKPKSGLTFNAMIKPARLKLGEELILGSEVSCKITAKDEVSFKAKDRGTIYNLGLMPLPPYIKRNTQGLDRQYYQTVYARHNGAVASPTAGLHFTRKLMQDIERQGTDYVYLTLHIGPGTFKPVRSTDITMHKMEQERFSIPESTLVLLKKTLAKNGRVFAVGTTSLRALETYAFSGMTRGLTDLFIYPGYKFKMAHCLLTNFHLPRTTLFMLVCAFSGTALIKKAYQEAIEEKYRFYSYGDAMLII